MEVFSLCCFFPCFNFVKAVGVCFLSRCFGFLFLKKLQSEFVITFQIQDVQRAKRPYSFIEFGEQYSLIDKKFVRCHPQQTTCDLLELLR